jgi:hypothetical protein
MRTRKAKNLSSFSSWRSVIGDDDAADRSVRLDGLGIFWREMKSPCPIPKDRPGGGILPLNRVTTALLAENFAVELFAPSVQQLLTLYRVGCKGSVRGPLAPPVEAIKIRGCVGNATARPSSPEGDKTDTSGAAYGPAVKMD